MRNSNINRLKLRSFYVITSLCVLLVSCQKDEVSSDEVKEQPLVAEKGFRQAYREAVARHEGQEGVAANLYDFMLADLPRDERMQAVRNFCQKQETNKLNGILELFRYPCPEKVDTSVWLLVVNKVMEFCRQKRVDGVSERLIDLAQSSEVNATIRDYAMQHYFLDQRQTLNELQSDTSAQAETVTQMKADLGVLFADPNVHSEGTMFGTSIMALTAAIEGLTPNSVGRKELTEFASEVVMPLLREERPDIESGQVAAIQTAGRLKLADAGPIIAQIAWDSERSPSERISALAALRSFPDSADMEKLTELSEGRKRLSFVARATLKHLQQTKKSQTQE